jgi:nitrate/TMAO reductase-like tetraheme cytochrome c subunit
MKFGRLTVAGYAVGMVVGLGLVMTYGAMEASSTPVFCGSCHVMEPYYDSWETSSHSDIACVDCHIPPGMTAELRKKFEALSMVARYFTATYGTNPWAEVADESCLQCHDRRLLSGTEVFGEVLFDHGPHLTELRRGKRLQCTSCHSQIVQGSHIAVTATVCILCHFKGEEPGQGTAECTLCHQDLDRWVEADGLEFDHGEVTRFGMACNSCHIPPSPDAGGVPRERCVTCHNERARLDEYENRDLLHTTHVTEHKVECTNCHLEIEHVRPKHQEIEQASECAACHGGRHSPQRALYSGTGGEGVPAMPDVMYRVGVRCEGCHVDHGDGETATAGEVACMSCHGPGYRTLYRTWSASVDQRTAAVRRELDATVRQLGAGGEQQMPGARTNVELVERGGGLHNVPYSLALLGAAHREINDARRSHGLDAYSIPWPEAPYESPCLECHTGVESQTVRFAGRRFPHERHVVDEALECQSCHRPHEQRERGGAEHLLITAADCATCHHGDTSAPCLSCHAEIETRTWPTENGNFAHVVHVSDMELECELCHGSAPVFQLPADRETCEDCH